MSHAAPIVRKTKEIPAKRNPTTYQIPVKRSSQCGSGPGRPWSPDPAGAQERLRRALEY
jgi:hypothetical protein